jgi:hypothetical protein
MQAVDSDALARQEFENAGREITQNFSTLNSNMSLAAGLLAAILAAIGAGILYSSHEVSGAEALSGSVAGLPRLSAVGLVVLSLAFPLLFRFFFRSVIAYQNLQRFLTIQKVCREYLLHKVAWSVVSVNLELFVLKWRSPQPLCSLMVGSLKYGFMWVFVVLAAGLAWGFATSPGYQPKLIAAGVLLLGAAWEVVALAQSYQHFFVTLSTSEAQSIKSGNVSD